MQSPLRFRIDPPVRVTIDYFNVTEQATTRRITVHGLIEDPSRQTFALEAWCSKERVRRLFRSHRMLRILDETGALIGPDALLERLKEQAYAIEWSQHEAVEGRLRFAPRRVAGTLRAVLGDALPARSREPAGPTRPQR